MKIIGHRGARGLAPENTIAAISAALEVDVDEIEVDARVTADNVVIVNHNDHIVGTNNIKYIIRDSDYQTLKQQKPDLATLTDIIETVNHTCPLLIEIKPKERVSMIITLLKELLQQSYKPRDFIIASFDQNILRKINSALPQLQIVINERWSGVRASFRARELGTKRIHMNARWLWIGFLKSVYASGYQLAPYTVNNPKKIVRWKPYLYGVITDYPDRFTSWKSTDDIT